MSFLRLLENSQITKMKFSQYNFSREIHKNLEALDYKKPTDIQYRTIPPILRGEDVLAIAQTGTGKTIAYALPVLELLVKKTQPCPLPHPVRGNGAYA